MLSFAVSLSIVPALALAGAPVMGTNARSSVRVPARHAVAGAAQDPPNIVLITTDDQTDYEMRWMPKTRRLLAAQGVTFTNGMSSHPLCCPARAQILTGQFAQNNGVRTDSGPYGGTRGFRDLRDTIGPWLSQAGYHTAFTGKYLNHYYRHSPRPPGWSEWHPFLERMGLYGYYDYTVSHNGRLRHYNRLHQADFLAEQTARLVRQFHSDPSPFFIWQSHVAPHDGLSSRNWTYPIPARRDADALTGVRPPFLRDPAFMERDMADKPRYLRQLRVPSRTRLRRWFTRRIQSLQSVDDAVARTVRVLRRTGELENTLIVFASDNGYLLGEHRYKGKILAYEQALQVPMVMRGPQIPPGVKRHDIAAIVDLAPTFVDAANAVPSVSMDGASLLPVARHRRVRGHDSLLLLSGPRTDTPLARTGRDPSGWFFHGVRTRRYSFVDYPRYPAELYDLARDPHQLHNVAGSPAYRRTERELARRTRALADCAGIQCRRRFGPVPRPTR